MNLSMNPKNLILLAALGAGAYWFTTRRATAAPVQSTAGQSAYGRRQGFPVNGAQTPNQATAGELGSTIGALWNLFKPSAAAASDDGGVLRTGLAYNSDPGAYARRQGFPMVDSADTYAVNPPDQYAAYGSNFDGWIEP